MIKIFKLFKQKEENLVPFPRYQNKGFTLAEVLITLAIIGIVAALTIGIFLPKIHSTIRARQVVVAETKFTKAMEQMALNNAIGPYYDTTQEFVDELQNYLKISKVCDNEHFEDCFGYDKLLLENGKEFDLSEIKTGENLGKNEDYLETVGLVTIDGTGMVLSWNKKCDILEPKVYKWGNNTNETTSCVAMLLDVNLDKSPNRINKDIALFRAESPSKACGVEFGDSCWGTPFIPTPITKSECEQISTINACNYDDDYWAGAVKKCQEEGKRLPNSSELAAFASYLYGTNVATSGDTTSSSTSANMNVSLLENTSNVLSSSYLSSSSSTNHRYFVIWSNVEQSENSAWVMNYNAENAYYGDGNYRDASYMFGVCVN